MTPNPNPSPELIALQEVWDSYNLTGSSSEFPPIEFSAREAEHIVTGILSRFSAARWRERWYGSDPQRGSAIVTEAGNLVCYLGGDKETHRLTTTIVAAHNAALPQTLTAPGEVDAVAASASIALMYLQTGFIECPQCGEEVPTKDLDATHELATVVQPAPITGAPTLATVAAANDEGVADMQVLRAAVKNLLPIGNDQLPGDRVIPIYVRMDELRALHALATSRSQHEGAGR